MRKIWTIAAWVAAVVGALAAGTAARSATAPDITQLPAFDVRASAFSDFGMSVKTNIEVKVGGRIEWMVVTAVADGSSAAKMHVAVGDRVLAMDGRQMTDMDRDAMLDALFQRKKGDRSRFLLLSRKSALPHFVVLVASHP